MSKSAKGKNDKKKLKELNTFPKLTVWVRDKIYNRIKKVLQMKSAP